MLLVLAVGCPTASFEPDPPSIPGVCIGTREQSAVRQLSIDPLIRDACQTPLRVEATRCEAATAELDQLPKSDYWQPVVRRIAAQVGIDSTVPLHTTADMRTTSIGYVGGVAGHNTIALDGKFLDILAEFATYNVLAENGAVLQHGRDDALRIIVSNHNMVSGERANAEAYPRSRLSSEQAVAAERMTDEYFSSIVYHEFGHYWAYVCVDKMRLSQNPTLLVAHPSIAEDDADFIGGVLAAKAGYRLETVQETLDIIAFTVLTSQGMSVGLADVSALYGELMSGPGYSSLNQRKTIVARGYSAFERGGIGAGYGKENCVGESFCPQDGSVVSCEASSFTPIASTSLTPCFFRAAPGEGVMCYGRSVACDRDGVAAPLSPCISYAACPGATAPTDEPIGNEFRDDVGAGLRERSDQEVCRAEAECLALGTTVKCISTRPTIGATSPGCSYLARDGFGVWCEGDVPELVSPTGRSSIFRFCRSPADQGGARETADMSVSETYVGPRRSGVSEVSCRVDAWCPAEGRTATCSLRGRCEWEAQDGVGVVCYSPTERSGDIDFCRP